MGTCITHRIIKWENVVSWLTRWATQLNDFLRLINMKSPFGSFKKMQKTQSSFDLYIKPYLDVSNRRIYSQLMIASYAAELKRLAAEDVAVAKQRHEEEQARKLRGEDEG